MPSTPVPWYTAAKQVDFDIDKYLQPWIPRSRLDRLPPQISRFLGYRDAPRQRIGNVPVAIWSMFGGFCGTAILGGLFMADFIKDRGGPIIIGSYGAAAILEYNAIESPFSQPRNQILGQFIAALIGICITKLFALSADFENLRWLAGALAVGTSSAAMTLTNTVHPPAGATALLAAVQPSISSLGWEFLGIVLLSSIITTAVACLLNNIHRQYPLYWWSPSESITRVRKQDEETGAETKTMESKSGAELAVKTHEGQQIIITAEGIFVPEQFYLATEERAVLKILMERLRDTQDETSGDSGSETGASELSKTKSAGS